MAYLSIEEAKDHLNLDSNFTEDDRYVESLINVAESSIEWNLGISLANLILSGSYSDLPVDVLHAEKILVSQWYESREPISALKMNKVPYMLDYILAPHKYWTLG